MKETLKRFGIILLAGTATILLILLALLMQRGCTQFVLS